MPLATTPYQQNDYQAASQYRPYELPINDIARALSAQDEFWKKGAARVKSAYENALSLKLSLEPNIQLKDEFLKNADKELTKLSTMNLADPSVQRQGLNIYKPLFEDEGIISDDAATRHIDKINQTAFSYKQKNDGKGYSVTNHRYALEGSEEFKNSTDRMAGKKYLEKRREYEAYHDPTQELNDILKNCKPDKYEKPYIQGFYIGSYSNESLSSKKITTCLDGGLSGPAKRQLQINGAVTYKNQPEALANMYIPFLQSTRSGLTEQKSAIDGILANKNNLKNIKPEDLKKIGLKTIEDLTPDLIKKMEETKENITKRTQNIDETIVKLNTKDYSPISGDNFESVAAVVYSHDYMQNVGEGFSYSFEKNTMKPDAAQMMIYTQAQMNARQEDDQQFDMDAMEKKFEYDLKLKQYEKTIKDGNLKGLNPQQIAEYRGMNTFGGRFSELSVGDTYEEVTNKRMEIANQKQALNQSLYDQLGMPKEYLPKPGQSRSKEAENWLSNYMISAAGDPSKQAVITKYYKDRAELVKKEQMYTTMQQIADEQTAPIEKTFKDRAVSYAPVTVKVGNSDITISGQDMYNALTGKGGPFKIVKGTQEVRQSGGSSLTGSVVTPYTPDKYYYNGREINTLYGQPGNILHQTVMNMQNEFSKTLTDVKSKRNDIMRRQTAIQHESYMIPQLNDKDNGFKLSLVQSAGINEKYQGKLIIQDTDGQGNLIVKIDKPGKGEDDFDREAAFERLLNKGASSNVRVDANGKPDANGDHILLKDVDYVNFIKDQQEVTDMKPFLRILEQRVKPGNAQSTAWTPGVNGNFRMNITKTPTGYAYTIISEADPTSFIFTETDRDNAIRRFNLLLSSK